MQMDTGGACALAENGYFGRVSSKLGYFVLNPNQRQSLVLQASVSRRFRRAQSQEP